MFKLNDVLLIGPYQYTVVKVIGAWMTVQFKTKTGEVQEVCVKMKQGMKVAA